MKILEEESLRRPPHGTHEEQVARMNRVQTFAKKFEDHNIQAAFMEISEHGLDVPQLEMLERWAARNSVRITDYQANVWVSLYSTLEQMRAYQTYFVRVAENMEAQQIQSLAAIRKMISDEQNKVIASFTHATAEAQSGFLTQLGEFERMLQLLDPSKSTDLSTRFSEAVLNGVDSGIQAQADLFSKKMADALSVHDRNYRTVNTALQGLIVAQAAEIEKLREIRVQDLATPIIECVRAEITASAEDVKAEFEKTSQEAKAKFVEMGDRAVGTVRRSCEQAVKDMNEVKQSVLTVAKLEKEKLQERFWIEQGKMWVGCFLMFIVAQWFVNLSWTYRLFH